MLSSLGSSSLTPTEIQGYVLQSIPLWRKYTGMADGLVLVMGLLLSAIWSPFVPWFSPAQRHRKRKREPTSDVNASTSSLKSPTRSSSNKLRQRNNSSSYKNVSEDTDHRARSRSPRRRRQSSKSLRMPAEPLIFVASPFQFLQAYMAMHEHRTQLMWFRRLYVLYSRYMFINTLNKIV